MTELQNLFKNKQFKCSVSSVLNKDVKQHGKMFMFDGLDDTAWYSDQGLPQHINILFDDTLPVPDANRLQLHIKFQGGFVGNVMSVALDDSTGQNVYKKCFYPDDINDKQTFVFDMTDSTATTTTVTPVSNVRKISILFEKSSDFFGRIIIYHLELTT